MANPDITAVNNLYGGNAGWNLSATLTATLLTVDSGHVCKINTKKLLTKKLMITQTSNYPWVN